MEMRFLTVLVEASGKVVSVEDLLVQVWDAVDVSHRPTTPLKSLVQRLRKKIEPDPQHPRFLLTVRGFGYLIEGIRREDTVSSSADDHRVSD
jgi:two-component system KDP operon response regulator KdpE